MNRRSRRYEQQCRRMRFVDVFSIRLQFVATVWVLYGYLVYISTHALGVCDASALNYIMLINVNAWCTQNMRHTKETKSEKPQAMVCVNRSGGNDEAMQQLPKWREKGKWNIRTHTQTHAQVFHYSWNPINTLNIPYRLHLHAFFSFYCYSTSGT